MNPGDRIKKGITGMLASWLLLAALAGVAAAFLYYQFVYVAGNLKKQEGDCFRVLARMGENIEARLAGFRDMVRTVYGAVSRELDKNSGDPADLGEKSRETALRLEKNKIIKNCRKGELPPDAVALLEIPDPPGETVFYISGGDFFAPLNRDDLFDQWLVLSTGAGSGFAQVFYSTFQSGVVVGAADRIRPAPQSLEAGYMTSVQLAGIPWKLFIQPLPGRGSDGWSIAGLRQEESFRRQARALGPDTLTIFLCLLFLLLFSIPILKTLLMGKFEQLDGLDVVMTAFSFVGGALLLTLLILFLYQGAQDGRDIRRQLADMADHIREETQREIQDACDQLIQYEERGFPDHIARSGGALFNVLSPNPLRYMPGQPAESLLSAFQPSVYPFFKVAFWVGEDGMQKWQLSTRNEGVGLVNVARRDYFRKAGEWFVPDRPEQYFMLESITSVTSGEQLAAVSRRSSLKLKDGQGLTAEMTVAALTSRFTSLMDVIVPAGYGFCMMGEDGAVHFHSEVRRNLQENFLREADNHPGVVAAVSARRSDFLTFSFRGSRHLCYITPFGNLPLFLVVFHRLDYPGSVHGNTLVYVLLLTAILLGYQLLLLLAVFSRGGEGGGLFPPAWLRPEANSAAAHRHLTGSSITILAVTLFFRFFTGPMAGLYLFMSAGFYVFLYNYTVLTPESQRPGRCRGVFRYVSAGILFLVIEVPAFFSLSWGGLSRLVVFQGLLALLLAIMRRRAGVERGERGGIAGHAGAYAGMLAVWFILACTAPLVSFYIDGLIHENRVALRHQMLKLARDVEGRNYLLESQYKEQMADPALEPLVRRTLEQRKERGVYVRAVRDTRIMSDRSGAPSASPLTSGGEEPGLLFLAPLMRLSPANSPLEREKRWLFQSGASDLGHYWWDEPGGERLNFIYRPRHVRNRVDGGAEPDIAISAEAPRFPIRLDFSLFAALLAFVAAHIALCRLLKFAVRRIFGFQLIPVPNSIPAVSGVKEAPVIRESLESRNSLFVHCLYREQMEEFCRFIEDYGRGSGRGQASVIPVLFTDIDAITSQALPAPGSVGSLWVITGFEFDAERHQDNVRRFEALLGLMKMDGLQAVVPLLTPLEEMIYFYREIPVDETLKSIYQRALSLLGQLRLEFVSCYLPLRGEAPGSFAVINQISDLRIREFLTSEFSVSAWFLKRQDAIYHYYLRLRRENAPDVEMLLLKRAVRIAQPHYAEIIRSCTARELFVLNDIAADRLVNPNNIDTILLLLEKRLLVCDGVFLVMNRSFRDFILESAGSLEVKSLLRTLSEAGNWKKYKAPLGVLLVGLVVFLAFQGSLLSEMNAIITAVVGALAVLTNVTGALSKFFRGS